MPPEADSWPLLKRGGCPDKVYENNRFRLVFDEKSEGEELASQQPIKQRAPVLTFEEMEADQEDEFEEDQ